MLRLTGAMLNNISTLTFLNRPTTSGPLVIVVDTTAGGGSFAWDTPTMAGVTGSDAPYILWNYPDATAVTLTTGDSIEGTIYAPRAHLSDLIPSNIEGDVIANRFTAGPPVGGNAGEIHEFPFDADLECVTGTVEPTPEPSPTCPTPTATEPGVSTTTPSTPGVTQPGPTPSATQPGPTPSASQPGATPSASQPGATPSTTRPGATPPGTAPPREPTPKPTCPPQLADTGSGSVPVYLAAAAALLTAAVGGVLLLWRRFKG
ncbi:choice-of-anchor A family protein [Streptomyces sp. PSKA28]|uniref:Choice-of-anchor A family protein n=1 Tax=Streptomyces himalayensis subsp. himalayensis TaxID=2756131 RepID=A0A7W0DL92_9ACTN|nr:choice-of-anchor A family protein [Streptomyces himalayensis subsp. himalayensis]